MIKCVRPAWCQFGVVFQSTYSIFEIVSSFVLRTYLSITMKMIAIHQLSSTWYCDEQGNAHFSECKQKAKEGFDDPRIYFAAAELDGFPPKKGATVSFFSYHNFLIFCKRVGRALALRFIEHQQIHVTYSSQISFGGYNQEQNNIQVFFVCAAAAHPAKTATKSKQ